MLSDAERRALPTPVYAAALLGVLLLDGCAALALATGRVRAGTLPRGAQLWRITACRVLAAPPGGHLGPTQEQYCRLLRLALAEPGLYYSDTDDATRAQQDVLDDAAAPPKPLAVRPRRCRTTRLSRSRLARRRRLMHASFGTRP